MRTTRTTRTTHSKNDLGYAAGCSSPNVTNNYFVGDQSLDVNGCSSLTITGNSFVGPISGFSQSSFPSNTYYGSTLPTGVKVFVRPNAYEAGRANIAIYNWDLDPTVSRGPLVGSVDRVRIFPHERPEPVRGAGRFRDLRRRLDFGPHDRSRARHPHRRSGPARDRTRVSGFHPDQHARTLRVLRRATEPPVPRRHSRSRGQRDHERLRRRQLLSERGRDARADGGLPAEVRARRGLSCLRQPRATYSTTCPRAPSRPPGSSSSPKRESPRVAAAEITARTPPSRGRRWRSSSSSPSWAPHTRRLQPPGPVQRRSRERLRRGVDRGARGSRDHVRLRGREILSRPIPRHEPRWPPFWSRTFSLQ